MAHRFEITTPGGQTHVVAMAGDALQLGSGAAADVMLQAPGLEALHLRFVRTDQGARVEPVRPGATVMVNGQELFCKDMQNGDVIVVAGLQLRWLADLALAVAPKPAPNVMSMPAPKAAVSNKRGAPSRRSPARAPAREPARPGRSRGGPGWVPVVAVIGLVLVAAVVVLRMVAGSTWPRTPQHYVELAREQINNNQTDRALDSLAIALRDATGEVREAALALAADIRRLQLEIDASPKVQVAQKEHDTIVAFATRYLRDGAARPAARELVRLCLQWLARHRDVCSKNGEGQPLLRAIEELQARYQAMAGLDEPDTAADVTFAAQSLLRFQWREYRSAMRLLDDFLQKNPADAEVRATRERLLQEGEQWLRGKLKTIDLLLSRGNRDLAARDLQQIETWSMLPEWASLVQERRQRLDQGR